MLQQVDDLDFVAPREMIFAESLEVGEGIDRTRGLASNIKAQIPFFDIYCLRRLTTNLIKGSRCFLP